MAVKKVEMRVAKTAVCSVEKKAEKKGVMKAVMKVA